MGRGLIILLVASLGLNIFAIGHMSGRFIAGDPPPPKSDGHHRSGLDDPFKLMRYAEELSPELREGFRGEFKKQLPVLREEHHRMRELRDELGTLMSADPWDGEAINAKLDEIREIQDRKYVFFNKAFVNAFEKLPAAERARLIEAADARRKEYKKRRHNKKREKEDRPPVPPGDE